MKEPNFSDNELICFYHINNAEKEMSSEQNIKFFSNSENISIKDTENKEVRDFIEKELY